MKIHHTWLQIAPPISQGGLYVIPAWELWYPQPAGTEKHWVDDFPNFPSWELGSVSWKVTGSEFLRNCLQWLLFFVTFVLQP